MRTIESSVTPVTPLIRRVKLARMVGGTRRVASSFTLLHPDTEQLGCDEELKRRGAPIVSLQTSQPALRQLERFGIRYTEQLTNPFRHTRRMTDQQRMLRFHQVFQPSFKLRWWSFVQQRVGDFQFCRTANLQNDFRRLFRADKRAAVGSVKFNTGPFEEPADFARFLFSVRREGPTRVVRSILSSCGSVKLARAQPPFTACCSPCRCCGSGVFRSGPDPAPPRTPRVQKNTSNSPWPGCSSPGTSPSGTGRSS